MTRGQAEMAIVRPALLSAPNSGLEFSTPPFEYTQPALERLLNILSASGAGPVSGVEASQLQIVCGTIEDKVEAGLIPDRDGNGMPEIDTTDLPDFDTVFKDYYENCLREIPETERSLARQVIEKGLVRLDPVSGESRRLSVDGGALLQQFGPQGLTNHLLDQLINVFLVRRDRNTLGGFNYELCHDTLLKPVAASIAAGREKKARAEQLAELEKARAAEAQERKRRQKFIRYFSSILFLAAGLLLIAVYALFQNKAKKKAELTATMISNLAKSNLQSAKDPTLALQMLRYTFHHFPLPTAQGIDDYYKAIIDNPMNGYCQKVLKGHTSEVLHGNLSSDGKFALTAGGDGAARLWNLQTDSVLELRHGVEAVEAALFTPDASRIFTAGQDGKVIIWGLNGARIDSFSTNLRIFSADISPDGQLIALGMRDASVRFYRLDGTPFGKKLVGHRGAPYALDFSRDGRYLVTGSWDGTARVWDVEKREEVHRMTHDSSSVRSVAFSPDGRSILTGCSDQGAFVWRFYPKDPELSPGYNYYKLLAGGNLENRAVAFSKDGNHYITCGENNTICLWDKSGKVQRVFAGHTDQIVWVALSQDGQYILSASRDKTARLWYFDNIFDDLNLELRDAVNAVSMSNKNNSLLSGGRDGLAIVWDAQGRPAFSLDEHNLSITSVAWDTKGEHFLTASWDGSAIYWDSLGQIIRRIQHGSPIHSAAFCKSDAYILTGGSDKQARLWSTRTGRLEAVFNRHAEPVIAVAYVPEDGVITGSQDQTAIVWDLKGHPLVTLKGHFNDVTAVAASSDGRFLLTGSRDQKARVWTRAGKLVRILNHNGTVTSVAFSPDTLNRMLTGSTDDTVRLWNRDGSLERTFPLEDDVLSVCFFLDGKSFVAGCKNKKAVQWSVDGIKMLEFGGTDANTGGNLVNELDTLQENKPLYEPSLGEFYEAGLKLTPEGLLEMANKSTVNELLLFHYRNPSDEEISTLLIKKLKKDTSLSGLKQYLATYRNLIRDDSTLSLANYEAGLKRLIDLEDNLENRKLAAVYYNAIAWNNLTVRRNFREAERLLKQALKMDKDYRRIYTNLPAVQLFLGNTRQAKALYGEYKDREFEPPATPRFREAFLEDIREFDKRGLINTPELEREVEEIRELLEN